MVLDKSSDEMEKDDHSEESFILEPQGFYTRTVEELSS